MAVKHSFVRSMSWRRIIIALLLIAQILITVYFLYSRSQTSQIITVVLLFISIAVALYVGGRHDNPDYKLLWIMIILVFPVFGGIFYLLFNYQAFFGSFQKRLQRATLLVRPFFLNPETQESTLPVASCDWPDYATQMRYLENYAGFPVYKHTAVEFLDSGEAFFERVLEELDKAEKYIFVESFIIAEGRMFNTLLEKMEEKAQEGVLVRLMYDDFGCFWSLPKHYKRILNARGIQCTVFSPFRPALSTLQNNRDHRKIISIDGKTAFTGGVNLADEYINEYEKFGHWRDSGVMLQGEGAWSLSLVFLQLWNFSNKTHEDIEDFYPWKDAPCAEETDGYVQPYADSPTDKENVGEFVYLQVINNAREYLYINTPYFIVDHNVMSALKRAAKSGVDVRIITPHIWDKRLVHFTTRSYYRELIMAGIKIYEYTRGFNHSKTFVADDKVATIGTVNLDYRSLYLHFECGTVLYGSRAVLEVKEEFLHTLPSCQEISLDDCKNRAFVRFLQDVARIFAPLM